MLAARDLVFELGYTFAATGPDNSVVESLLRDVRRAELVHTSEFDELFTARFSSIVFALREPTPVDAGIDPVESLDGDHDCNRRGGGGGSV